MDVVCCLCGVPITPNDLYMCPACIANEVNIEEGIDLSSTLMQCPSCLRYQTRGKGQSYSSSGSAWVICEWESTELMALCLKSIHGLQQNAKLIDANFVYTEPHSKRVVISLVLRREAEHHAMIQKSCKANFTIQNMKCPDCTKTFRDTSWRALVQLRQKANHKRTFFHLEQVIVKQNAHEQAIGIVVVKDGMDFYFASKSQAEKFVHFIGRYVAIKSKSSSKLVSENVRQSTANLQTTLSIDISPICKDDLLVLPAALANKCGQINRLVLCSRATSRMHMVCPRTGKHAELTGDKYWKTPFLPLASRNALIQFVVLDVEPVNIQNKYDHAEQSLVADVEVIRESDFGVNETTFIVRSHLGRHLSAGDHVLGYDLTTMVFGGRTMTWYQENVDLADIILVQKVREKKLHSKISTSRKQNVEALGSTVKLSKAEEANYFDEREQFAEELEQENDDLEHAIDELQLKQDDLHHAE